MSDAAEPDAAEPDPDPAEPDPDPADPDPDPADPDPDPAEPNPDPADPADPDVEPAEPDPDPADATDPDAAPSGLVPAGGVLPAGSMPWGCWSVMPLLSPTQTGVRCHSTGSSSERSARWPEAETLPRCTASVHAIPPVASWSQVAASVSTTFGGVPRV